MNRSCGCSRFQGSTNNSNHCNCRGQQQQQQQRRDNKKDDCCCVDTLAKKLKKLEGQLVAVFEKGYIAVGVVEKVKDKEVLVLSTVTKLVVGATIIPLPIVFPKVFISICDIIEVGTLPVMTTVTTQVEELLANLQSA